MQTKQEPKLYEDVDRDIFWTKIDFLLDNSKELIVFALVSYEHLRSHYNGSINGDIKEKAKKWLKTVVQKWDLLESDLKTSDKNLFYDIDVDSPEGYENAVEFLKTKQNF